MQNRRTFIRQAGLGLVTLTVPGLGYSKISSKDVKPILGEDEEEYWKRIKMQFPLSRESRIYMNNGTMGPSPQVVIDAQMKQMNYVNQFAVYGGGEDKALQSLARLLNVDEMELGLTHNVTEGLNIIALGIALKEGDEVVITDQEHAGHGLPWLNRVRLAGVVPKVISPASTAQETLERIKKAVTPRTKVIAVPHILCTTGQVMPVKEISDFARENGIYSVIDGAHAPGMIKVDIHAIGCDFYASCCHKWMLGPKGTGFIYVSKERLADHESYHIGAHAGKEWVLNKDEYKLEGLADSAHRYFYGTQSSILYLGIEAAIKFQEEIGIEKIEERVTELAGYLYDRLKAVEGVEILTPSEQRSRAAIISFKVVDADNDDFYSFARKNDLILRFVGEGGLDCIRVSTHIYNSKEDVDHLIGLLSEWKNAH